MYAAVGRDRPVLRFPPPCHLDYDSAYDPPPHVSSSLAKRALAALALRPTTVSVRIAPIRVQTHPMTSKVDYRRLSHIDTQCAFLASLAAFP